MSSIRTNTRRLAVRDPIGVTLACLALLAPAYAATQSPPEVSDSNQAVLTDLPKGHPHKHRIVKPGPAEPKTYPSQPQPIVNTLRSVRSPS